MACTLDRHVCVIMYLCVCVMGYSGVYLVSRAILGVYWGASGVYWGMLGVYWGIFGYIGGIGLYRGYIGGILGFIGVCWGILGCTASNY